VEHCAHFLILYYPPHSLPLAGTHSGTLAGVFEPTGKTIRSPPQSCSLTFNEEGLVIEYTIGK
jgi:hypothetical protein